MPEIVIAIGVVAAFIGAFLMGNATFADRYIFGFWVTAAGVVIAFFGLAGVVFG